GVASAPAIAGIVSYFAAFVTLQSARARVIALAFGALGRISLIVSLDTNLVQIRASSWKRLV
nr:hypothetical protein [Tanacetum cinerariifolium]